MLKTIVEISAGNETKYIMPEKIFDVVKRSNMSMYSIYSKMPLELKSLIKVNSKKIKYRIDRGKEVDFIITDDSNF